MTPADHLAELLRKAHTLLAQTADRIAAGREIFFGDDEHELLMAINVELSRVRLAASGAPPREPSEAATEAHRALAGLVEAIESFVLKHGYEGEWENDLALLGARAILDDPILEAASSRAPRVPDGPWQVVPASYQFDPPDYYLTRPGRGEGVTRYAGPFTEAEARAALPALNWVAVSGGAPQP